MPLAFHIRLGAMVSFTKRNVLLVLLLAAVFLMAINTIAGSFIDTGYEIKTGEIALHTFSVPKTDVFSFAYPTHPWIAHYWLSGVIFYLENALFGFWGLIAGSAVMAVLTYFFVFKTVKLRVSSNVIPSALIIPISYLTYELWVARPQIFSYFFLAVLIFLLEKWRTYKNKKTLYWIPPLFLFWANMHAGVILGIAILSAYFVEELLRARSRAFLTIGIIAAACTLINPNGYKTLFYSSIISRGAKEINVAEWQSLLYFLQRTEAKIFLGLMILASLFVLYKIEKTIRSYRDIPIARICLVIAAITLPLVSIRHVGYFPIIILPLIVGGVADTFKNKSWKSDTDFATYLVAFGLALIIGTFAFKDFNKESTNPLFLPANAVSFAQNQNLTDRMFHTFVYGGYLIYRLYPQQKVFIDGRTEVYEGTVNQEYLSIMRQSNDWKRLVDDKYKFDSFFLSYWEQQNWSYTKGLFNALVDGGEFKLVYWDDAAVILARNSPKNNTVIKSFGYNVISPFTDPRKIPPELRGQAVAELERASRVSPTSKTLKIYGSYLMP